MGAFGAFASPFNQLRPIQAPSPMEYAAQFGQLQALAQNRELRHQEMQLRQQEQQANQIKIQESQAQQRDQQLLTDAYIKSGGDRDKFRTLAAQSGARLSSIDTAHQALLKQDNELQTYNKGQLDIHEKQNAAIRGGAETLLEERDPARRASLWTTNIKPQLAKLGIPDSDLPAQLPTGPEGEQWLQVHRNWGASQEERAKQLKAQREAETATLTLGEKKTADAIAEYRRLEIDPATGTPTPRAWEGWRKKYPEMNAPLVPTKEYTARLVQSTVPEAEIPKYQTEQQKVEATKALLANPQRVQVMAAGVVDPKKYPDEYNRTVFSALNALHSGEGIDGVNKAIDKGRDVVAARENAAAGRETGPAAEVARRTLENMPTAADAEFLAKKIINHEMSPSEFNQLKMGRGAGGFGVKVFQAAERLQPGFDAEQAETEYKTMAKTENDFTTGKEATLVRANNNALEHLALLDQARVALKNGDIPALNRIANYFGVAFGSDKATTFDHIAQRVGDEVSKAFLPGGGGQAEREKAHAAYGYNLGDTQIASNIKADVHLMDSQQRNLQNQYTRGTYGKGKQKLYTDEAMAARSQIMGTGGGGGAPALPTKLTQADVGKTYTAKNGKRIKITAVNPQNPTQFRSEDQP